MAGIVCYPGPAISIIHHLQLTGSEKKVEGEGRGNLIQYILYYTEN
jgi:hypothetical protein